MAQLAVLEENVHRLPQRVVKNFDHLLMHEWVLDAGIQAVRAFHARQGKGHRILQMGLLQCRPDFGIAFGRTESHDHVFGAKNRLHPRTKKDGEIKRGKGALAHNYGMDEFHRNVLRVGGVGSASKGQQTATVKKSFRHLAAGNGQAGASRAKNFSNN